MRRIFLSLAMLFMAVPAHAEWWEARTDHFIIYSKSSAADAKQFAEKAEPLKISINGQEMLAEVKQFSTGSFGWYLNGKTVISVDGKAISVQIGMNMTVVGSKEAARE